MESPTYGRAMVAMAMGRTAEAEQLFDRALAETPWFYEAYLGKAENRQVMERNQFLKEKKATDPSVRLEQLQEMATFLTQAEVLAPSDEGLQIMLGDLQQAEWVQGSAHGHRDPAPPGRAITRYERARVIQPDSINVLKSTAGTILQMGFHKLSTGADPGLETATIGRELGEKQLVLRTLGIGERSAFSGLRHNLWWVAAEADHRFGRDPRVALAEAAQARKDFGAPALRIGHSERIGDQRERAGLAYDARPDVRTEKGGNCFRFMTHPAAGA